MLGVFELYPFFRKPSLCLFSKRRKNGSAHRFGKPSLYEYFPFNDYFPLENHDYLGMTIFL